MLKVLHAQEDFLPALKKTQNVSEKLESIKLPAVTQHAWSALLARPGSSEPLVMGTIYEPQELSQ